jgi:hypothetical protein
MGSRRRGKNSLRRKVATRPVKRTIVVFTEGRRSEPDYVRGLARLPQVAGNNALSIEISPRHGVPYTLVDHAVEAIRDPDIDECWCLFDVEYPGQHPNVRAAVDRARAVKNVNTAISNPCFEVWLVMHFQDVTTHFTTAQAESLSRKLDGRSGKGIDASAYTPRLGEAARRAEQLASRHLKNGTVFPDDNPSSSMFEFLKAIGAHRQPDK